MQGRCSRWRRTSRGWSGRTAQHASDVFADKQAAITSIAYFTRRRPQLGAGVPGCAGENSRFLDRIRFVNLEGEFCQRRERLPMWQTGIIFTRGVQGERRGSDHAVPF